MNRIPNSIIKVAETEGYIITTAIEHKAVLQPLAELEKKGFEVTYIFPNESGRVNANDVLNAVKEDTLLVSVMHANNETGIIQPVKEIGDALVDKDIFFHVDAAQTFGKLVDELREVKYTFLSASAHKMYGPQGIGILVMRKKRYKLPPLTPMFFGGSQEHGFRPGTVPTALIAGMGEACSIAENEYAENLKKYEETKQMIYQLLDQSGISFSVNGDRKYCIPNTLNIRIMGMNSVALMQYCKQFCGMSNGSACNAASHQPSHVLKAMGFSDEHTEQSIRLSWGNEKFDDRLSIQVQHSYEKNFLSTSKGVRKFKRFLGRLFISSTMFCKSSSEMSAKEVPFGKNCRSRPLVFSFVPRCHGE